MAFLGLIPVGELLRRQTSRWTHHQSRQSPLSHPTDRSRCNIMCRSPQISLQMKSDLTQVDARTANTAIKCLKRLHKRYWALTMKGKIRPVAITAIAREFVGFHLGGHATRSQWRSKNSVDKVTLSFHQNQFCCKRQHGATTGDNSRTLCEKRRLYSR